MTNETALDDQLDGGVPYRSRRRILVRAGVPVAVGAVIAAGVGLVPALAADSPPDLPQLSAEQVVTKVLGSDAQALSGTVSVSTDLGVPSQLLGAAAGGLGAAAGHGGDQGQASADPQSKLLGLLGGDQTLRVAVDGPDHQRVDLMENMAGYTLVHNGDQSWAWDSSTNTALHVTGRPAGHAGAPKAPLTGVPSTPQEAARQFLTGSAGTTSVTVAGTATVAGQKAYQLSVKPTQSGSTLSEVRIAVAADNGVPLAVVVKSTDGSTVLDVHFTDVSFAKPAAKTFDFTAPKGAKVTEKKADEAAKGTQGQQGDHGDHGDRAKGHDGVNVVGDGWTAVVSTRLPGSVGAPAEGSPDSKQDNGKQGKRHGRPMDPQALVKSLGKPVGGGTLISTKVVNVLLTDDGRVFAGAVTLSVLQHAAGVN
ncbi:outer membrane lipoprotein carrier protein LolA [Kitasatospora sp. NPDC017646]|uniref:outer membrane lipoprotein carrier protein LolA n=1 Tax=Kitasatospora sp. NPDC017646 TaxID=3364024 RepID=UPI0037A87DB9